jgi:cytochrome c oxidase, cbb3-type, subunit I
LIGFFMFVYNIYKSMSAPKISTEPKSASPMGQGIRAEVM